MALSLRIYVDFDDVVAETARGLAGLLYREYGRRVAYDDIAFFDLRKSFQLDAEAYRTFMEKAHESDILQELDEAPGACAALRAWLDDGLSPVVVTGRPASSHAATRHWLDRRGLSGLPILHVDKYNRELGPPNPDVATLRFDELHALAFDVAVDDAPTALDLLAESRLCPFVIFDRPWNRSYVPVDASTPRAADWSALDRLIRSRANVRHHDT